ncbi:MAG: 16S rRNA (guanine(966)-N(2))-methyltransferase RsmD [Oscillospiraceae bacterium]|jgi:16S rRNA (guanine(966)-N(2))-methyltransferase RsmD|nr:16S rRNA (guanine(966)-N(2))-methyltransferase RsmD [Oscillospiraceae bacterium]
MRVITGTARGVPLQTLPGEDVIRPTSQRVKEALFSAIQFEVAGRRVLDAFAGCGQLGIEALSRGAQSCLFLDQDAKALQMVQKNLERTKFTHLAQLLPVEALQFLRRAGENFDLIFLDPPYKQQLLQAAIPLAAQRLAPGGLLVCEAPAKDTLPDQCEGALLRKTYHHGKTKLCVYAKGLPAE